MGAKKRYWLSWYYLGLFPEREVIPFPVWESGIRCEDDASTMVALIDAESEKDAWALVAGTFGPVEERFTSEKPADWTPGDRFPMPEAP